MSEVKPPMHQSTAAAEVHSGPAGSRPIFPQPVYITVARGAQALLGLVILCMAGYLIHGLAMDAIVFALVCGLFTLIVVGYALLSEKVPGCQAGYNYWAILSLDLALAIFWLAAMGANAANRAAFTVTVNGSSCYNDGSAVNSNHCTVWKRAAVAGQTGLAVMSAIAGLSALQCILFIGTTAFLGHQVRLHLQANKKTKVDATTVEANAQQAQPMLAAQSAAPLQHPQYTADQQYGGPAAYQQQTPAQTVSPQQPYAGYQYPQHTGPQPQYPQQTPSPLHAQQTAEMSAVHQTQPAAELYQQNPQQMYSPASTPAPQQPHQQPHHPPQ